MSARRDTKNDPQSNGEYELLSWYCKSCVLDRKPISCFDIGAMHADWTYKASEVAKINEIEFQAKVFEASPSQADRIQERIENEGGEATELCRRAVSHETGKAKFAITGDNTGSSSLVIDSTITDDQLIEVDTTTIDEEIGRSNWDFIDIVKIDTEGNDYSVIVGALDSLVKCRIGIIQFEYNWRWLNNHRSLKDVFELVSDLPYRLGKLCGDDIELYQHWHPELDRFIESNYVLLKYDLIDKLPATEHHFIGGNVSVKV